VDFNGDGKLDVVVANAGDDTVSVLVGNGDGTFRDKIDHLVGQQPRAVAVADLDGDGKLDVVASGQLSDVLLGSGTVTASARYATGANPASVAVADVNGDGTRDLVVANLAGNTVSVFLGNGGGRFVAGVEYYPTDATHQVTSVAIADVDRDGVTDLVATTIAGTVELRLGNGDGSLRSARSYASGMSPIGLVVEDLNGDGMLDFVLTNANGDTLTVLLAACLTAN